VESNPHSKNFRSHAFIKLGYWGLLRSLPECQLKLSICSKHHLWYYHIVGAALISNPQKPPPPFSDVLD